MGARQMHGHRAEHCTPRSTTAEAIATNSRGERDDLDDATQPDAAGEKSDKQRLRRTASGMDDGQNWGLWGGSGAAAQLRPQGPALRVEAD